MLCGGGRLNSAFDLRSFDALKLDLKAGVVLIAERESGESDPPGFCQMLPGPEEETQTSHQVWTGSLWDVTLVSLETNTTDVNLSIQRKGPIWWWFV